MNKKQTANWRVVLCKSLDQLRQAWLDSRECLGQQPGQETWYRGMPSVAHELQPSLFWRFANLSDDDLDRLERNLFFEFQARARELHERGLSDWDYLFFMRHHGMPTRILDWTDAFAVALHFALTGVEPGKSQPCIWALNPYALNKETWNCADLIQPKYLGWIDRYDDWWDYGELLEATGPWEHDGPVAMSPLQISERMRAQRGWFTLAGNKRKPLEKLYPEVVFRIDIAEELIPQARDFLAMAGIRPYSVYPDLDHLGLELVENNKAWTQR